MAAAEEAQAVRLVLRLAERLSIDRHSMDGVDRRLGKIARPPLAEKGSRVEGSLDE